MTIMKKKIKQINSMLLLLIFFINPFVSIICTQPSSTNLRINPDSILPDFQQIQHWQDQHSQKIDLIPQSQNFIINGLSGECISTQFSSLNSSLTYQLNFDLLSQSSSLMSQILIIWNNKIISRISSKIQINQNQQQQQQEHSFLLNVLGDNNVNRLEMCPLMNGNIMPHKIFIIGLILKQFKYQINSRRNIIKNGNFQQNTCITNSMICKYDGQRYDVVNNWILSPGTAIGKGQQFNQLLLNKTAIFFPSTIHSCIQQHLTLLPGIYLLDLSLISKQSSNSLPSSLPSSTISIFFNEKITNKLKVQNYVQNNHKIQIINLFNKQVNLSICGGQGNENQGVALTNVKMFYFGNTRVKNV